MNTAQAPYQLITSGPQETEQAIRNLRAGAYEIDGGAIIDLKGDGPTETYPIMWVGRAGHEAVSVLAVQLADGRSIYTRLRVCLPRGVDGGCYLARIDVQPVDNPTNLAPLAILLDVLQLRVIVRAMVQTQRLIVYCRQPELDLPSLAFTPNIKLPLGDMPQLRLLLAVIDTRFPVEESC